MSQPADTPKSRRNIIISLIALITVAVLVISLIASGFLLGKPSPQGSPSESTAAQSQPSGKESSASGGNASGGNASGGSDSAQQPATELDPQLKQAVENEHRKDPNDPRALGSVDAPVIIEMYSDYRCGHCRDWSLNTLPELQDLIDSGKIRVEYNSLPILGKDSILAAQASHAAALQNKFWEYHKELFTNLPEVTPQALTELAGKLGMDTEKFAADLVSDETVAAISGERSHGIALGITGTPAFLIGYSFISGALPADRFISVIDQEMQRF
ncbi:DsbA family protein [Arcanobacterium pinnipediorum]|uniref:Thioredoxin domain-containing protein n=1 Tax=Arcanobacterium pinnipediorum TaxID=1503041 RepID=A0ABY5AHJ5_9ACTO|nr:thioredoxin domain-containing protein [Arcanobacterium pinnipediorum]USR79393.1 thioredoxin domain-containing protein [Arcanobacterium pinnipediorum]